VLTLCLLSDRRLQSWLSSLLGFNSYYSHVSLFQRINNPTRGNAA